MREGQDASSLAWARCGGKNGKSQWIRKRFSELYSLTCPRHLSAFATILSLKNYMSMGYIVSGLKINLWLSPPTASTEQNLVCTIALGRKFYLVSHKVQFRDHFCSTFSCVTSSLNTAVIISQIWRMISHLIGYRWLSKSGVNQLIWCYSKATYTVCY